MKKGNSIPLISGNLVTTQQLSILLLISIFAFPLQADTAVTSLPFSVDGASMWSSGPAFSFHESNFFGLQWDEFENYSGPGFSVTAETTGRVGLEYDFHIDTGSVNIDYPMQSSIQFPDYVPAGDPVVLNSSYTVSSGANMNTFSPQLMANVSLPFEMTAGLFGELHPWGFDPIYADIALPPIDGTTSLLDIDSSNPFFTQDFGGFGNITASIPTINTSSTMLEEILFSSGSDDFISLSLDVDNVASTLIPWIPPLEISESFGDMANLDISLIDVTATLGGTLQQDFQFSPNLLVDYTLETGQTYLNNKVGESFGFIMPSDVDDGYMDVTATYHLDNTLTNSTSIGLTPGISLDVLQAEVDVFGHDIAHFGPAYSNSASAGLFPIDVYSSTFPVGGFPVYQETFSIETDDEEGEYKGCVSGEFTDPIPHTLGVYSGFGTSSIEWGVPFAGSFPSRLSFYGSCFEVEKDEPFLAGVLLFRNGTIGVDTGIDGATLNLEANLSAPIETTYYADPLNISIVNTLNVPDDPWASADIVYVPGVGNLHAFEGSYAAAALIGQIGSFEVLGMSDILYGDGFVTEGELTAVANAGGPYTLGIGDPPIILGGSVEGNYSHAAWDLDADGSFDDAIGLQPSISTAMLASWGFSPGTTWNIGLQVTDYYGDINVSMTQLTFVPAPGAVILGSIGLSFAGWLCKRRKS